MIWITTTICVAVYIALPIAAAWYGIYPFSFRSTGAEK